MDYKRYLIQCIENMDKEELSLSYAFLGRKVCDNETMAYIEGSVYQISNEDCPFNGQIFYCDENYFGKIDWAKIKTLDEAQQTTLKRGLTATCFTFLNTKIDNLAIDTYLRTLPEGYVPFSKYATISTLDNILIDDDQYYQIMQVIGQPFIKDRELEYNRQAILKLAVEPALRMYYTYFPLIQEEVLPNQATGDYLIPYPTEPYPAYKAIAWVTTAGANGKSLNGISPLAALGTDVSLYTRTAQGSKFNTGLRYNKPVPGWNGESSAGGSAYSEMAAQWPIANTMKNMMRREKLSKIHIPGKGLFAKGYSTMSGFLNIKWLCWSRDFDDVEFEDWPKVIQLCQAHVKFSIGAIRDLLRSDSNVPIREGIQKEGEEAIAKIESEWKENPIRLIHTPARGGLVG